MNTPSAAFRLAFANGDHRRVCPICKRNVPTVKNMFIEHTQLRTGLRCPNSGQPVPKIENAPLPG